jgi:hypothetical protein
MSTPKTNTINTPTPSTMVIDVNQFSADQSKVNQQRSVNMGGGAIVGSILAGIAGYYATRKAENGRRALSILGGAAAGAGAGFLIGQHIKTNEEGRSDALLTAAKSGNFEHKIKDEMEKREDAEYSKGLITGALSGGWWMW